jgi:FkbM family methyltransferase
MNSYGNTSKLKIFLNKYLYIFKRIVNNFRRQQLLDYNKKNIIILCDNLIELDVRKNSCSKEPETIMWLESFKGKKIIFWDIGANIGAYSLVAASLNYKVLSFEPAFQNYFKLNQNITANKMDSLVKAFCISFGKKKSLGNFNIYSLSEGSAKGNFNSDNYFSLKLKLLTNKTTPVFTVDEFIKIFNLEVPNLIKIDVDGGELDILEGSINTLKNHKLKSLLVEFDTRNKKFKQFELLINKSGFKISNIYDREKYVKNYILKRIK